MWLKRNKKKKTFLKVKNCKKKLKPLFEKEDQIWKAKKLRILSSFDKQHLWTDLNSNNIHFGKRDGQ